ncbi:MAG: HNH endonuclease signature motif containing protein [Candidatus Saccharibacteria bacterium]
MSSRRKWNDEQLMEAVKDSRSYRQVLIKLSLIPAGGNYVQVQNRVKALNLDTKHFLGMGWNVGLLFVPNPAQPLSKLLVKNSTAQSYVLKKRLFVSGLLKPKCELCGWAKVSKDGRIPVELDHINGNHYDNRIHNLRILCPNCHSLQTTHRGKNKGSYKHLRKL